MPQMPDGENAKYQHSAFFSRIVKKILP